jgi:hypothetical protein
LLIFIINVVNSSYALMYLLFNIQSPSPIYTGEGPVGQLQTRRITPVRDDTFLWNMLQATPCKSRGVLFLLIHIFSCNNLVEGYLRRLEMSLSL